MLSPAGARKGGGGVYDPGAAPLATNMSHRRRLGRKIATLDRNGVSNCRQLARALGIGTESPERSEIEGHKILCPYKRKARPERERPDYLIINN